MRGIVEYTVAKSDLWQLILRSQEDLTDILGEAKTATEAIRQGEMVARLYYNEYEKILQKGLTSVAKNAVNEYNQDLGVSLTDDEIKDAAADLLQTNYKEKYFGTSLDKRLEANRASMFSRIKKSAYWGANYAGLKKFFTEPVPYGSQFNMDNRVLLAQAVKIEQDAIKEVAKQVGVELIKWTLSSAHTKPDICDDLATAVTPEVVRYMEKNNIPDNPAGVYFREELPFPPHPNCMCEFSFISSKAGEIKRKRRKRRSNALSKALKRLKRK